MPTAYLARVKHLIRWLYTLRTNLPVPVVVVDRKKGARAVTFLV